MRTTVNIDDQLLKDAKTIAAQTGRTLTNVFEDALRESLARRRAAERRQPVELPTFTASLRPGVDLDDSAALLDLMDRADAAP